MGGVTLRMGRHADSAEESGDLHRQVDEERLPSRITDQSTSRMCAWHRRPVA